MYSRQTKALIGTAMVAFDLIQTGDGTQTGWVIAILGMFYTALGVVFLWSEVYSAT